MKSASETAVAERIPQSDADSALAVQFPKRLGGRLPEAMSVMLEIGFFRDFPGNRSLHSSHVRAAQFG
jgi:hypothetical protein